MISPALLVILGLGALNASQALRIASLRWPIAADVFAVGGALVGVAAFVAAVAATSRSAGRLP